MTHIYRMDDCEWVAADSEEQAKAFYEQQCGEPPDDDGFWVLSEADMDAMQFTNDEAGFWGLTEGMHSFRVALAGALASGADVPFLFASTEQ